MVEKTKKLLKGSLSEEDISTLLQRYTATTVLALLQEVAHCPDVKIDWNALVKNTSTGISDAREYQMLWRHLAYRHDLLGKLEYGAHPLDDDSDLEYEVGAFPTVSSDVSTEAAACVKRWAIIRKRRDDLNVGPNSTRSQLSEERRAAHHAMSLALDMPIRNLPVARPAGMNATSNSVLPPTALPSSVLQVQDQPYECSNATKSSAIGSLGSKSKAQSSIKPKTKPTLGSDSALRATAVAAGARIASPSDAASFIKATQAKSAVHFKPTDGSSTKLSMPGGVSTLSDTQTNVRYICPGLEAKPCSSYHAGNVTNTAVHTGSVKAVPPTVQHASSSFAIPLNLSSSEQANAVSSTLPSEVLPKQEVMAAEEIKVSKSGYALKEEVQGGARASQYAQKERVREDEALSADLKTHFKKQMADVKNSVSSLNM
ncbi:hypothetical protein I3760_08G057100 [Carya illinoinensis]|nr:hypothetical protein I3760_08G057100 [Carya illinoinensis]